MPSFSPQSFFDIGSGPGTGLWAADAIFSDVKECFTWEIDDEFNHLSQTLTQEHPILKKTIRRKRNLEKDRDFFSADLVLMSYSIGEIASEYWDSIFKELWSKLHHTLVIVEPGTPAGYDRILKIRDILLNQGANLIAPCPHAMACPLSRPDWCHFYARVERSSLHRKIKNAELNYEDEKFSYLVFSKQSMEQECQSRILRHPQIQKGYVKIVTCDKDRQIKNHTIRKKDKEIYKLVKKLDWGDCI
jgi:ribosomal protein RSM22 (predicted rRNA methylase)